MSRPKGPLPPRVYWFRRMLVLSVAMGLVVAVAQLLGSSTGDEPGATARVASGRPTGPASMAAPSSTDDARPGRDRQGDKASGADESSNSEGREDRKPKKTQTPPPEPTGPCDASDIVATPEVPGDAYAGGSVRFRVTLTTRESPACTWTVSPTTMVVKLVSGQDRIWSSQDCPAAVPSTEVVVRKDFTTDVDVVWRGQRSDSTCSRTTAWAQPGWYHVQAAAFGSEPSDVQFELEPPVRPTVTATPKKPKKQR
jgi:hypothetical protein